MKRKVAIAATFSLVVGLTGSAAAGPLEDASAAYASGHYATAMRLWRPLAEEGDAIAQFRLGEMYLWGQGVRQSYAEALIWYLRAAEQGNADAQRAAGSIYIRGQQGVPQDRVLGQKWFDLAKKTRSGVPLKMDGGIFVVPVQINGTMTLDFVIDSGAADVSVPADVVSTLRRAGTIKETDFIGQQTYVLADGSKSKSVTFTIRSLKVGDMVLENVRGSVASPQGSLLLGQSFLERFKSWSVDNTKHELFLEPR
jgi:clan AA aspartic protease (TIGR02281 family)